MTSQGITGNTHLTARILYFSLRDLTSFLSSKAQQSTVVFYECLIRHYDFVANKSAWLAKLLELISKVKKSLKFSMRCQQTESACRIIMEISHLEPLLTFDR